MGKCRFGASPFFVGYAVLYIFFCAKELPYCHIDGYLFDYECVMCMEILCSSVPDVQPDTSRRSFLNVLVASGKAFENGCIETKKVCLKAKTHLFFCFL